MQTIDPSSSFSLIVTAYFIFYIAFLFAALFVVLQIIRRVFKIPHFLEYRRVQTELLAKIAEKMGVPKEEIDEVIEG